MSKLMVTPKGVAVYPHLNTPDEYQGQRTYKCDLRFAEDDEAMLAMVEKLEAMRDEYWANPETQKKFKPQVRKAMTAKPIAEPEYDEEGNETGFVIIKARCNAEFVDKRTSKAVSLKPKVVDATGKNELGDDVQVWGGSVVKVAFQPTPWAMAGDSKKYGCKVRLKAVQVIELVSGGDAAGVFDEEEGFEYEGDGPAPQSEDTFGDESQTQGNVPDEDDEDF